MLRMVFPSLPAHDTGLAAAAWAGIGAGVAAARHRCICNDATHPVGTGVLMGGAMMPTRCNGAYQVQ
jgi:hypothetical protein